MPEQNRSQIPNIVLNASTTLILSLINNYKLPEKCQTFRSKSIKYMHLTNAIEDSLTNDIENINIDKIRNFINEYVNKANPNSMS
jgi:hypothetical protein